MRGVGPLVGSRPAKAAAVLVLVVCAVVALRSAGFSNSRNSPTLETEVKHLVDVVKRLTDTVERQQVAQAVAAAAPGVASTSSTSSVASPSSSVATTAASAAPAAFLIDGFVQQTAYDRVAHFSKTGRERDAGDLARCRKDFGFDVIDRWSRKLDVCKARDSEISSSMRCFKMHTPPDDYALCYSRNSMAMDSAELFATQNKVQAKQMGNILPAETNARFKAHNEKPSFVLGDCARSSDIVLNTFVEMAQLDSQEQWKGQCEHWVDHPVYFISRYDHTNMFHASEDMITVFESLAILHSDAEAHAALSGRPIEVVIADVFSDGFYLDFYQRVGWGFKLRLLKSDPFPKNTCFRFAIHNAMAMHSTLSDWDKAAMKCPNTVLEAYSGWVTEVLNPVGTTYPWHVPLPKHELQNAAIKVRRVLYVSRTHFELTHPLNGWQQGRAINNNDELTMALQKAVLDFNKQTCVYSRSCGSSVATLYHFQAIEPSEIIFRELFSIYSKTDVLIGMHGAALTGMFFMPKSSFVIEMTCQGNGAIFDNMAVMLEQRYRLASSGMASTAPVQQVVELLNAEMRQHK